MLLLRDILSLIKRRKNGYVLIFDKPKEGGTIFISHTAEHNRAFALVGVAANMLMAVPHEPEQASEPKGISKP